MQGKHELSGLESLFAGKGLWGALQSVCWKRNGCFLLLLYFFKQLVVVLEMSRVKVRNSKLSLFVFMSAHGMSRAEVWCTAWALLLSLSIAFW